MKKKQLFILCAITAATLFSGCGSKKSENTLTILNYGKYIEPEVIEMFEEETGIEVDYEEYITPENMYTKYKAGAIDYDLICTSDYMVEKLINEGQVLEMNYDNIPLAQNLDKTYFDFSKSFDPENKYSVPYTWGNVGIIYNTKYVDEGDIGSWDLLWNSKYAGKILMFDNCRDAFAIAEFMLDYSINTQDETELRNCAAKLSEQKPILQGYVMDQIYAKMIREEAWIAPYYAGDYLTMAEENENLAFYLPEDQGFNLFIDAMCIPKCSQNKAAAERFINFLCRPDIAGGNMDWVCYGTPVSAAKEYMDPEVVADPVSYPDDATLDRGIGYLSLPRETTRLMEELFMQVRNGLPIKLPD